ncbi:MAG: signal peptidase II [Bryobacteraceae bacterium]|nr:signal peptidase II [Bryobacteraceae bacterium]
MSAAFPWRPFLLALAVALADRLTKVLVETRVQPWEMVPVIPGFFQIVFLRNTGIAFGFLQSSDGQTSILLVLFSLGVLAFIGFMLWQSPREHWTLRYGLGCVLGGAAGNLYDRIVFRGVTDFLDFYWGRYHFPAFNVADAAITCGAGLLLLNLWLARGKQPG